MVDSRKCPCRYCNDRHAGCHSKDCPNGWYEWEMAKFKEYEERERKIESENDYYDAHGYAIRHTINRSNNMRSHKR